MLLDEKGSWGEKEGERQMKKDLLFFFFLRHLLGFLENWNWGMN
jgi:hypothetical protein